MTEAASTAVVGVLLTGAGLLWLIGLWIAVVYLHRHHNTEPLIRRLSDE